MSQSSFKHGLLEDCEPYPPKVTPQEELLLKSLLKDLHVDPDQADTHVVFLQILSPVINRLYLLLAKDLANHGIPSSFLFKSGMAFSASPLIQDGVDLANSVILQKNKLTLDTGTPHTVSRHWTINPENRVIEAEGVNFYPVIAATMQVLLKSYDIPFHDSEVAGWLDEMVTTVDLFIDIFFLLKKYARHNGKVIKLVAWECGYLPNGILFLLCRKFCENRDVEFIDLRFGYPRYLKKGSHEPYLLACNRTALDMPTRYSRDREEFEKFMAAADKAEAERLADYLVPPGDHSAKNNPYLAAIADYKAKGRRVFVLLSHLFYDTGINEDRRCFTGMTHWIRETIHFFRGRDDILVLKPHPMEAKRAPRQTLASLAEETGLEENMLLLPPNGAPLNALFDCMTCGLIWRTTGALELLLHGVPCNICGFAEYHFLDLPFSRTEKEYFQRIEDPGSLAVTQAMKEEAMYCFYDLKLSHIHVDCFDYDPKTRLHTYREADVRALLENHDPEMARLRKAILD